MNNKLTFDFLENTFTKQQIKNSNWLLLYYMEKTIRYNSNKENRDQRRKIFDDHKQKILPDFKYSNNFHMLVKQWWTAETKWYNSSKYDNKQLIHGMCYRILAIFFRNHNICPFVIDNKDDNEEFHANNQKLFEKFLNRSMIHFKNQSDILNLLRQLKSINMTKSIESAKNELHDTFLNKLTGFVIGGAVGVTTSLFLGPVIGRWIGSMAGLSGAAATSFGLALLGGGSLASGGFGMLGGSIILGTLFGVTGGIKGAKNASINEINIMQAHQLPVLLAIGRLMYEIGNIEIPSLIHTTISKGLEELKERYKEISKEKNKKNMENLIGIYEKAQEMSKPGGWIYDCSKHTA